MSRGPRAEASRTAARRSIRALAWMVDELLDTTGLRTESARAWLASWSGERVADAPWHLNDAARALLDVLRDARLDVWRHVTHEHHAVQRVLRCAAVVLRVHQPELTADDARAQCAARHAYHLAEIVRAEMGEPWQPEQSTRENA